VLLDQFLDFGQLLRRSPGRLERLQHELRGGSTEGAIE
jgi:hypothetical protein